MNDQPSGVDDKGPIDDRLFDRLVDGALNLSEQRDLLRRLDRAPDGWRRCALAFLESQTLRNEFGQIRRDAEQPAPIPEPHPGRSTAPNRSSAVSRSVVRVVGMALALCVAFVLGWQSHFVHRQQEMARTDGGTSNAKPRDQNVEATAVNQKGPDITQPTAPEPEEVEKVHVAARLSWQYEENGTERKVEVPVFEGPGIDMQWLLQQSPQIQESIRKELQQRGHKVETQRQLLTVDLKDGRSVIVPIDHVQVKFAKRVFQ